MENTRAYSKEADVNSGQISAVNIRDVEFKNVSFGYEKEKQVLSDVSFQIDPGESVAVVGPTGAGKTSLINLLVRFYEPSSGRILVNGKDISEYDIVALRAGTALVMQDPFLFSGTIRQNIIFSGKAISDDELEKILRFSNCKSLVDKLPKGVDTMLSEAGASLSSGQRQLISIARAIATNPDLIILDEATSYIDSESEKEIQEALFNIMEKRTSIIIAHRLSTARNADRIIVLNNGRIIETGSHEELMQKKGFYFKLHTFMIIE